MDLRSEIAVERESVKWEVGPTKDAIQAFMETLVDPKLPYECLLNETPSIEDQNSIARQMHAVVLLYNYYHRKQKPELQFLDFVSFCKLALSVRPKMKPFMKMIHGNDAMELNGAEDQLSVTEKAIKNACDIALSLDASKDAPNTEGCPISKVAVLLIDSDKENCLLQRDVVTEGVWSLIEKEINEFDISREILVEGRVHTKKKINNGQAFADHRKFLQIGFDALKGVTGIDVSDLEVLEAHVVYSLSKEKSAAQFYIMKCNQSFDISQRFSFENLLESLQGPLTEMFSDTWVTTSPVEHYCLLPYLGFISSWLPRKDSCVPIFGDYIAEIIKNKDAVENSPSRVTSLPLAEYSVEDLDYISNNGKEKKTTKTNSSDNVANEGKDSQKKRKHSPSVEIASSVDAFFSTKKHGRTTDDPKTRRGILNSSKCTTRVSCKGSDTPQKASLSGRSRGQSQNVVGHDNSSQSINMSIVSQIPLTKEIKEKRNLDMKSKSVSCAAHVANGSEDGVNLKAETTGILKSNDGCSRDDRVTAGNGDANIFSTQNGITAAKHSRAIEAPCMKKVENGAPSEDLQNALALLDRKRLELYSRLCTMEDTLALYEHIIDRVRDGGDVGFAHQCIEFLLRDGDLQLLLENRVKEVQGKAHQLGEHTSNPKPGKQTKISNTYLPGISSCQDLEYTCLKNNWRLPRYFVQSLDGDELLSSVVLHCSGRILSSKGGSAPSPLQARESAAAHMLAKIRALLMEEAN